MKLRSNILAALLAGLLALTGVACAGDEGVEEDAGVVEEEPLEEEPLEEEPLEEEPLEEEADS